MKRPTLKSKSNKIFANIYKERQRQEKLWGPASAANIDPEGACIVLGEEFGEVCRAILEARHNGAGWKNYRTELIQVAAVAVAMIQCHDDSKSGRGV